MRGPTVRHIITIVVDNELPFWDKDLYECYGTLDLEQCMKIDADNYLNEVNEFLDRSSSHDPDDTNSSIRSEVISPRDESH